MEVIIKRKQVTEQTTLSRSSIYLFISQGKFPPPLSLGSRSVGWRQSDITAWIDSRKSKAV